MKRGKKSRTISEKVLIEEVTEPLQQVRAAIRGLSIGALIKAIRTQLGMSQSALAKRAGVPQSTISRIEQGHKDTSLSTLAKVLTAISCDLVVVPLLEDSIDTMRTKQARKIAEKHIDYLKGTMKLEDQEPDPRFIEELIKQEQGRLLGEPGNRLWEE